MAEKETNQVYTTAIEDVDPEQTPVPLQPSTLEKLWIWEFVAWFLSLGALAAVVAVLKVHQNQPNPSSLIHGLERYGKHFSINSYISIFSTVFRLGLAVPVAAALSQLKWTWFRHDHPLSDYTAIDSARHGALGSALLLLKFRGRHLVSLGAFITLAALIVDFSFQSLVSYPLQPRPVGDATAVTYRAQGYSSVGDEGTPISISAATPMLSAIYAGLYNNQVNNETVSHGITPICSTGNCTWPVYTSIGVCSQCVDVTSQVQIVCGTYLNDDNSTGSSCNYTAPDGNFIAGVRNDSMTLSNWIAMNVSSPSAYGDYTFGTMNSTLSVLSVLQVLETENQYQSSSSPIRATQCALYVCVRKFHTEVKAGKVTDVALPDTYHDDSAEQPLSTQQDLILQPPASFMRDSVSAPGKFTMNWRSYASISGEFVALWNGTSPFLGASRQSTSDVMIVLKSLDLNGIAALLQSIATSMTTAMRFTGDANNYDTPVEPDVSGIPGIHEVVGVASQNFPIVVVTWRWIVLPAGMSALTLVFLVLTIAVHRQAGYTTLWKGYSLAYFYQPLTADAVSAFGEVRRIADIDRVAANLNVKWTETERGWRLAKNRKD